ncbi:hypothetical protein VD0002_g1937 [Verticillium dahliae]|uniref:Uncharacterized protein n=2 Tax=Verticillium dahliae TaxID=27337 RepID=G2WZH8_VERDV|nr:uncharacterized protein VDAG_03420 [Verticillium dahliae VdLs.17]KAF3346657.1 UPF0347 membrane protein [Verticillium dahliae VDG2]KAH6703822.1 hypothetical protein EV126DRAFT_417145 [Verticillium dahliae]EGY21980.1 hypothetical protein VDAG_03420 [Verticillium dahliae VdLs.17]PNH29030.1 hypothetical protein BJF96_g7579 [Verticillium dahliae]PNH43222.1 hypothetical protein VD0004_g4192 [Verticillium dahliae]
MVRLPPAEKLSLVLRKNIRDEWDNKKSDYEKQLSDLLGETWTIDINPNAIWPYHNDGYAKESVGSCIKDYVEGVIWQIKYQAERYPHLTEEINTIASAHILGMDVEDAEPKTFSYGSVGVQDGKLMILFRPDALGSNISYAAQEDQLFPALNAVPSDAPLSFLARHSIKTEYDAKIDAVQKSIATQIAKPDIKLIPNFEASFATLKTAAAAKGSEVRDDWEKQLGYLIEQYFEGLDWQLKNMKIEEDDLIQEGFNEAVEKGELVFRLVDTLKYGSYGEVVIEDGTLYLQALPSTFGSNVSYAAEKLVDQL